MTDTDEISRRLRAAGPGPLADKLGIELLDLEPGRVRARMPVAGNTQPHGLLHGGATAALAETVASWAATLHAGAGRVAVGTELSITHHRAAREGAVVATATALHEGRTAATYGVTVVDDAGRRVATARLSCRILEARA